MPLETCQLLWEGASSHCPSSASAAASFFTDEEREMMVRLLVRGGGMHTGGRADNVRICDALGVSPKLIMALETAGPRKSSCSTRGGSNYSSCSSRWNRASSRQRYGHWHIFWLLLAAAGCCCCCCCCCRCLSPLDRLSMIGAFQSAALRQMPVSTRWHAATEAAFASKACAG